MEMKTHSCRDYRYRMPKTNTIPSLRVKGLEVRVRFLLLFDFSLGILS